MNGMLICSDLPGCTFVIGKNKELQVFLFEQSIIFSETVGKKTQFSSPRYTYKAHFRVRYINKPTKTCIKVVFLLGKSNSARRE